MSRPAVWISTPILFCSAAIFLGVTLPHAARAEERTRLFVGSVVEAKAKESWFVMRGGASKRYARVKVLLDAKTKWDGINIKGKQVHPGERVRVTGVEAKGGAFRAVTLYKIDPNEKPVAAGVGAKSPR